MTTAAAKSYNQLSVMTAMMIICRGRNEMEEANKEVQSI
jgi:hypothetical protein